MRIRQRVAEAVIGKGFVKEMEERVKREVLKEAISTGRKEDEGWRSLTDDPKRDLTPISQERMQEIAFYLYDTNIFAHRLLELIKDFVVGEGVTFTAKDPEVEEVLKEFWDDSVNAWDRKGGQRILELGLFGEAFYPVAVNDVNGKVRMGCLDPVSVARIVTDPENVEVAWQVKRKGSLTAPQKTYDVIREDDNPKSPTYEKLTGDIFFFAVNKISTSKRGRSDLFALADWVDGFDQFLFNALERSHIMNVFLWDVTLKGYDQPQIDEWLKDQSIPKPASIRAHNEQVKWEAVVPDLGSHDTSEAAKLFRNHMLGGAGLPPHWYAGGEGITRATALEMGVPVIKRLKTRQRVFKHMIEFIFRYVIHQAVIHQRITRKDVDQTCSVVLPKILEKDVYTLALGLKFVMEALEKAIEKNWVEEKDARRIFAYMMSQLGLTIEAVKEREEKKEENELADE